MLLKNAFTKISVWLRSLRFRWVFSRDNSIVIVPCPIVLFCREGFVFGFMFLSWQIGFQFTNEV